MIRTIINEHVMIANEVGRQLQEEIKQLCAFSKQALQNKQTIFLIGNGGSAADCQHIAAELVGRFQMERAPLPAIALTTDTSILTAIGNDYGFNSVFSRQIEALVKNKDVVIAISTSGNSENIIEGVRTAKQKGAVVVGFTGMKGGELENHCDLIIKIPSQVTARIQEMHILIGHLMCEIIERELNIQSEGRRT